MAEIASPASDPRSLRRHYPHQALGVVQLDLSAIAAPPHSYLVQHRTRATHVNHERTRRPSVMAALHTWNVVVFGGCIDQKLRTRYVRYLPPDLISFFP